MASALLLAWMQPTSLEARQPMRFERLSIEDGLSQSVVNCILQDSTGFLWLGTQDGLNRYDGYRFKVYRHDDEDPESLPHDLVLSLATDPSGDLWIGTEGGGLARWRRASDTFLSYRHDAGDPESLADDRVVHLAWDPDGTLWIATFASGLDRYDPTTGSFQHFRHDPADPGSLSDDRVRAVHVDRRGELWVGTFGGLNRYDRERRSFVRHRHDPGDPSSLSDDRVRAIAETPSGDLWIGTLDGLNRLAGGGTRGGSFERYPSDPAEAGSLSHDWVRSLLVDRDGHLWVGTDGGLNLWRPASGTFDSYHPDPTDPNSLANDRIVHLYQDRGGVLWIGTLGGGVSKWNPATWSFPYYRGGGEGTSNMVLAISEDPGGELWVGTFGGGLERILRQLPERRFHYRHVPEDPDSLSDDRVTALLHDRQGTLWVGTLGGGLNRLFNGPAPRFERYRHDPSRPDSLSADAVTVIYEDRPGRLWIGTHGGGLNLHRGDGRFVSFRHRPDDPASLGNDRVLSLAQDRDGMLWLATDGGGLNRFHPATGGFLRLLHDPADPGSLSSNEPNVVHVDPSGQLWIGTEGTGLDRLESLDEAVGRARFRNFSQADGLPDEKIWGIRSDAAGHLWLSTNRGLSRFDPRSETFKNYDASHGLQSDEFMMGAHFQSPSGELFFGGINGLNAFYPDRIEGNRNVPPVVVTAFSKINRPVRFDRPVFDVEEIVLDHRDYFFSVEFAALDFAAPGENRYRYKLEGFDADWIELGGRRQLTFTNLDAGRYTLRLQGSNNDGVWSRQEASVKIVVAPPPWESWWAYTLYALALAAAAGGVVRHQRNRLEHERAQAAHERAIARRERTQAQEHQRLLEEREQLIAELEAKNVELERFNYTVSHDLKNPLVTIKGFLGLLRRDAAAGDAERLEHDISRIDVAADRMSSLLEELLELSRLGLQARPPEEVPLDELVPEAIESIKSQAIERGVEVIVEPGLPVVLGDRLRLLQLYQNLLINGVKYMGEQIAPRIEVGLRDAPVAGDPVLFVRDNGMGIEAAYQERVFGLFERLDAANEGTGIGLALAERIVEMHGGRIWVESRGLGHGSTFCWTLSDRHVQRGAAP